VSSTGHGSFWPSATQRALLEVALGPIEEAAARWQALQPLDVTTLEPGAFGLLPLLHDRLIEAVPDEPQLARLAGTYRSVWYRNRLLLDRLGTLLAVLQDDGIDPLLLGGAAAVLRWYPRLGLRPVMELELAVEPADFERAASAAARVGWRPSEDPRQFVRLRDDDGRMLVVHSGLPPAMAGPAGHRGAYQLVRARAARLEATVGSPLVLDPADDLLFVCAAGARVVLPRSCQWLVDVHAMVRSGSLPQSDELLARARHFHLVEPLRATLAYLTELLGGDGLEEHLGALGTRPGSRRDRLAFLLAGIGGRRTVAPAQALSIHLQATAEEPLVRVAARLPRTLQERWGAGSLLEVPALALRKTARLVRAEIQAGTSERSRSASS